MGLGFSAQQSVGQVDVGIGMPSSCNERMNIGKHIRGSTGGVVMNVQNGSTEELHLGIERTHDLIGMQNQNLQSSVALTMTWNTLVLMFAAS